MYNSWPPVRFVAKTHKLSEFLLIWFVTLWGLFHIAMSTIRWFSFRLEEKKLDYYLGWLSMESEYDCWRYYFNLSPALMPPSFEKLGSGSAEGKYGLAREITRCTPLFLMRHRLLSAPKLTLSTQMLRVYCYLYNIPSHRSSASSYLHAVRLIKIWMICTHAHTYIYTSRNRILDKLF